jgi:hypothetical protein
VSGSSGEGGAGGAGGSEATATALEFDQQPASGTSPIADIRVRVVDEDDETVTAERSVTLALAENPSAATLGGTLTQTTADGIATFTGITLDRPGTGFTLRATSDGLTEAISDAFDVTVAANSGSGRAWAITATKALVSFELQSPERVLSSVDLTGFTDVAEAVVGMDFRPADGALYVMTLNAGMGRLYTVNVGSGAASLVGSAFAVAGTSFGFDFNPAADRIRVVSDTGVNVRVNPADATVTADTALSFVGPTSNGAPAAVAAAYTNNVPGASATTLYVVDASEDRLYTQSSGGDEPSPNGGELTDVGGTLGTGGVSNFVSFDIAGNVGHGYMLTSGEMSTSSRVYDVTLSTGAAVEIGRVGIEERIVGFAIDSPPVYAVSGGTTLISFNAQRPGTLLSATKISGLQANETILGIDFRPATGVLYALGSSSRLYWLDRSTAAATAVGTEAFTPALNGASFGFDVNPVADAMRVVSDTGQNLRISFATGAATNDTGLNPPTPHVVAVAYAGDNNAQGVDTTSLFGIDTTTDDLVPITNPNGGTVTAGSDLGIEITSDGASFDIGPDRVAYGAFVTAPAETTRLYTIPIPGGPASLVGDITAPGPVTSIAIPAGVSYSAYGITPTNQLVRFNPTAPAAAPAPVEITGLETGDAVVGIDIRPENGGLYAVAINDPSDEAKLYTINPDTAVATRVGSTPFATFTNDNVAVDFNPVPGLLRVISGTQNIRVNVETGAVEGTDIALAYATGDPQVGQIPGITALAYSNNRTGVTRTNAYTIDSSVDRVVRLGSLYGTPMSPNTGELNSLGSVFDFTNAAPGPLDVGASAALDFTSGGTAFLSNGATIYVLNIADGSARAAASNNTLSMSTTIRALAVRQN